jgi:hypothetical protein
MYSIPRSQWLEGLVILPKHAWSRQRKSVRAPSYPLGSDSSSKATKAVASNCQEGPAAAILWTDGLFVQISQPCHWVQGRTHPVRFWQVLSVCVSSGTFSFQLIRVQVQFPEMFAQSSGWRPAVYHLPSMRVLELLPHRDVLPPCLHVNLPQVPYFLFESLIMMDEGK